MKSNDGAGVARRTMQYGLVPMLLTSGACAMAESDGRADRAPTASAPLLTISGRLTDEGVECQALRGDDGQLYTLVGDLGGLKADARVRASGRRLEISYCQQGTTIQVSSIARVD